jgi:hypothetical protein
LINSMPEQAEEKLKRRRGAPGGERNGNYRHGRYSRVKREERQREMNERHRAWMEQMPRVTYPVSLPEG